jgi:putative hemolysin
MRFHRGTGWRFFGMPVESGTGPARRVKFRFGMMARRWGFPRRRPQFGRRPASIAAVSPETAPALPPVHEPLPSVRRFERWPVLAAHGALEVRIAETEYEIEAAQRLRYRVFYEEMSAIPTPQMRGQRRDFDKYDAFCDHLLVVDNNALDPNGEPAVVGCYRLLRGEVAAVHGGYYTSSEYDLTPMLKGNPPGTRYLELGRSCVLKSYRTKALTMQLLWRGVVVYLDRYAIDVMFGCGSLPGTDPEKLKLQLSFLHHFHSVPEGQRVSARPELYVSMNGTPKDQIDPKEALRSLPPLIKGYVRAGSFIGDGAVIDKQFGTTDVLIYFPVSRIGDRWRNKLERG